MQQALIIAVFMGVAAVAKAETAAGPDRLNDIVERGSHVMPFALDKTRHVFEKTPAGGIQQVVALDLADQAQISLIRQHLSQLAAHFKQGDFSGPVSIHGANMPGVKALSAGAAGMSFSYSELPDGAQIIYTAQDQALIAAVHRYFDAQLHDHGHHAVPGAHSLHHGRP